MQTFFQDLRYGARMLFKNPGFTLTAILTLALGIGANTAIFSVVNAVLLKSYPYRDAERLVMVWEHNRPRAREMNVVSPANFLDWKERSTVFEDMAGFVDRRLTITGVDDPEEIPMQFVTENFFPLLGINPTRGRNFTAEDAQQNSAPVVILSYGLWQRRFGGDADIVGKRILLNGTSNEVIGVMPPDYEFFVKEMSFTGKPAEMWAPLGFSANSRVRRGRFMLAIGRLNTGVTLEQARAEMNSIGTQLEEQYPDFNKSWGINLVPIHKQLTGEIGPALMILLGAVGFVLLIACANVANLLLARAATREREIAIRAALGANRRRIVSQLLTESLMLAGLGGALGLLLAWWGLDALTSLTPPELVQLEAVSLDYRVLGFTLGVSLLTGIGFGLVPGIVASRTHLSDTLKEGGRGLASGAGSHRARNTFVVAQVALALVLLVGAGLLIRSLQRLQAVDPGFTAQNVLTARLALSGNKYREDAQIVGFFNQLKERLEGLPGVQSVSANAFAPFTGPGSATSFTVEGRPEPPPGEDWTTDVRVVQPDYFKTLGIRLLKGRDFNEREARERTDTVIVSETLARNHFPDEDPIGKRITINMRNQNVPSEIIGVVSDVKHESLDKPAREMTYWAHPELAYSFMTLLVRTDSEPLALASAIQNEVRALDKDLPLTEVRTLDQWLSKSVAKSSFATLLMAVFAAVALILAAVGIYGVMAYSVTQRKHEIGVRVALGAKTVDVVKLVLGRGMTLTSIGIGIGLAAAFGLTRLITTFLYQTSATDLATFLSIPVLIFLVALLASYIPARRATKVDPMVALRYE